MWWVCDVFYEVWSSHQSFSFCFTIPIMAQVFICGHNHWKHIGNRKYFDLFNGFGVKNLFKVLEKMEILADSSPIFSDDLCKIRPFETQIGMETDAKKHLIQATSHLRSRGNFLRILLLLSGNVERNPGPVSNYTLDDVNMCGFYMAALYFGFSHRKLIPVEQGVIETAKRKVLLTWCIFLANIFLSISWI